MSRTTYLHILMDDFSSGIEGQEICKNCKLHLPENLEPWENYLNGEFTKDPPSEPGYYLVVVSVPWSKYKKERIIAKARKSRNNKKTCVWDDDKLETRIEFRWSQPIPLSMG